ncbi:hypothetical protein [Rhizobium ruizarguesonis]|uniref:hypothetical protein n=1 Tax=Rhizobium ruizarguesonis TaxID=2081791 RepID=UPI0013DE813F|nr:hypothetical protein [Rhizobium ruizarguesonis]NEJ94129.1 hypothetical protein [Rhizobium ruizarguesonis]
MTLIHQALVEQHQIQGSLWLPFLYGAYTAARLFMRAKDAVTLFESTHGALAGQHAL